MDQHSGAVASQYRSDQRLAGTGQEHIPEHAEKPVINALEESGHVVSLQTRRRGEAMAVRSVGRGGSVE